MLEQAIVSELTASESRLRIASLLSVRPRTLGELSGLTGISIQGVIKHLNKLDSMGLIREKSVKKSSVRKIYSLERIDVGDYSVEGLTVVKISRRPDSTVPSGKALEQLQNLAEETLILRRRVREKTRKLGRMIDELFENQNRVRGIIEAMKLSDEDRLVLDAVFTEETLEEAETAVSKSLGTQEGRRTIDRVLSRAKGNG